MEKIYDMLIIGGGPGGYTAALYAAQAGLSVVVLERMGPGGQMAESPEIDNYPGLPEPMDGYTLGAQMQSHAARFGAETKLTEVNALHLEGDIKSAETTDGVFRGKTVVIATGATPRRLDVPGEAELAGQGVHYCATCDGMFYRGKTVAVIGGGNSAAEDALVLSRIASKVLLVHRRDTLRASAVSQKALQEAPNVELVLNARVKEIRRGELVLQDRTLPCDGVFIAVGRVPSTDLVKDTLALDEGGYILAGESTQTVLPGVFAAGDVRSKALRQIITACADGASAVHSAQNYLAGL